MANTKSAKGKVREISKKTDINKSVRNRYRTCLLYTSPSPRD